MLAIVHSIYSQSVHALALNAGSMDNGAGRYCIVANLCNVKASFVQLQICSFIHSGILGACITNLVIHSQDNIC